jgi:hypothetical protein
MSKGEDLLFITATATAAAAYAAFVGDGDPVDGLTIAYLGAHFGNKV